MTVRSKQRGIFEKVSGSGVWWIRFADGSGRVRREKGGTKSTAIKLYQRRKTEVLQGKKFPENLRSVTRVSDLEQALLSDYAINRRKSDVSLKLRLRKHIIPFFGSMPANDVGTAEIERYISNRRKAGAENGTINRELAALKRMFRLAYDSKPRRVRDLLRFPRLKENAPERVSWITGSTTSSHARPRSCGFVVSWPRLTLLVFAAANCSIYGSGR